MVIRSIYLVSNTTQIASTKLTTLLTNFDKIQGDTFIVWTVKWHLDSFLFLVKLITRYSYL